MTDFRIEISNNILNEVDDKMINYYFANSHIFEKPYENVMKDLHIAKVNCQTFQGSSSEKKKRIEDIDKLIDNARYELFYEISKFMSVKRQTFFWETVIQKNPIFTIHNPFFIAKALENNFSDVMIQSVMFANKF